MHAYLNNSTKWEGYLYGKIALILNPEEDDFLTTRLIMKKKIISHDKPCMNCRQVSHSVFQKRFHCKLHSMAGQEHLSRINLFLPFQTLNVPFLSISNLQYEQNVLFPLRTSYSWPLSILNSAGLPPERPFQMLTFSMTIWTKKLHFLKDGMLEK